MSGPDAVARIQAYLRENARLNYESEAMAPFTLFFHPHDRLKYFNYAIPDEPVEGDPREPLARLRAAFAARERTPRFEFFEAFAPALPGILQGAGFVEEERLWSMLCTPETYQDAPYLAGLAVSEVQAGSPDADVRDFLLAQRQGFDPAYDQTPSAGEIQQARADLEKGAWRVFLGRVDGVPAGVASFGRPIEGVSEVAGIATRPAFRRRGIAAYLTAWAVRAAFAQGAQVICLTAASPEAGRVYERAGFRPFSIMLAYIAESAPAQESERAATNTDQTNGANIE